MFNKYKSRGFGKHEYQSPATHNGVVNNGVVNNGVVNNGVVTSITKNGTTYAYQKPAPAMPFKDIPNAFLHPLLQLILETKRPTKEAKFCLEFICNLLDASDIIYNVDAAGNVSVDVDFADDTMSTVCFTSHTDTVDNKLGINDLEVKGNLVYVKGGGVLGADCGTGMYIMIRMIEACVPGHYVFFASEEVGRVGSKQYDMPEHITTCVSFDRKGYDNLITTQSGRKGCSDDFADALIKHFGVPLVKDPTGSYTDSFSFFDSVNECINLSVGYFNQHTQQECQDIEFLPRLIDACVAMDWDGLPVERDPIRDAYKPTTTRGYGYGYGYGAAYNAYGADDNDDYAYYTHEWGKKSSHNKPSKQTLLEEFCFEHYSVVAKLLTECGLDIDDCETYKEALAIQRKMALSSNKIKK